MSPTLSSTLLRGLSAFWLSLALTGVGLVLLRRAGVIDRPNARSSHAQPTVRGGGVGFVAVGSLAGFVEGGTLRLVATAVLLVAVVSFVDDLRGLGVRVRLAVHALAALLPAYLTLEAFGGAGVPGARALAATAFLGTVGYTNAFNFMDGIDGIAGTQGVIGAAHTAALLVRLAAPSMLVGVATGAGLAPDLGTQPAAAAEPLALASFAAALAGATAGFLPYNLPRARAFMGDVGSAFLGCMSACLVVIGVVAHGLSTLAALALVHAPFVLDAGLTLGRRAARGERLSEAHREHFYQRAVRSGASHVGVTSRYAALAGLGALLGQLALGRGPALTAGCVALELLACLATFASIERTFRARATSEAPTARGGAPSDVLRP